MDESPIDELWYFDQGYSIYGWQELDLGLEDQDKPDASDQRLPSEKA